MSAIGDSLWRLGVIRHGQRFTEVMKLVSCMEPYIDMPWGESWDAANEKTLWYLDGQPDTPLWFWR